MPRFPLLLAASLVALTGAPALAQSAPHRASLDGLAWLTGCWRLSAGERTTDEQWMAPAGGIMMGMSRTVVAGRLREYERIVLREVDGRVAYEASPSGQAETTFTSTVASDSVWIFANEAHDFPQRVVYRRLAPDSLEARIEGVLNGQPRVVRFPMRRVGCEPVG